MPEIQRSALVPYSPQQMFDLVCDVERYPEFLSWVTAARNHERGDSHQVGELELSLSGVKRRIRTRNDLIPGELLRLNLDEGPFERFTGEWRFTDLGIGSRVALSLGFQFDNPVLVAAFGRGFISVANRMVDDFCRRADELYG